MRFHNSGTGLAIHLSMSLSQPDTRFETDASGDLSSVARASTHVSLPCVPSSQLRRAGILETEGRVGEGSGSDRAQSVKPPGRALRRGRNCVGASLSESSGRRECLRRFRHGFRTCRDCQRGFPIRRIVSWTGQPQTNVSKSNFKDRHLNIFADVQAFLFAASDDLLS